MRVLLKTCPQTLILFFLNLFISLKLDIDESEENCRDNAVDD